MALVLLSGPFASTAEGQAKDAGGPSQVNGVNFLIKSQVDNNFCIQVASGGTEGRTITLQNCGSADTQRWVFTHNNDDTNLIVDSQGMCLDGRNRKGGDGLALPVMKCRFGDAWHYTFMTTGQIRDMRTGKCLSVAGAVGGAAVSMADCDATKKTQLWTAAH